MTLLIAMALVGLGAGLLLPIRWGVRGFMAATAGVFLLFTLLNTVSGFEGTSLEESLLLFNNSYVAYIGFNLQITYRAFVLPLLCLTLPFLTRLTRANRTRA